MNSIGKVLFVNRSLATLLARVSALVGPIPQDMVAKGRFSHKFFTKYNSLLYERDEKTGQYLYHRRQEGEERGGREEGERRETISFLPLMACSFLQPKRIQLKDWLKTDDLDFLDFVQTLLTLRPDDRYVYHLPLPQYSPSPSHSFLPN